MLLRSRALRDTSYEDMINILEDITTIKTIIRKYKPYRNVTSEKSDIKLNPSSSGNKEASKDVNPYKDKKCYKFQNLVQTSTSCTHKKKKEECEPSGCHR